MEGEQVDQVLLHDVLVPETKSMDGVVTECYDCKFYNLNIPYSIILIKFIKYEFVRTSQPRLHQHPRSHRTQNHHSNLSLIYWSHVPSL